LKYKKIIGIEKSLIKNVIELALAGTTIALLIFEEAEKRDKLEVEAMQGVQALESFTAASELQGEHPKGGIGFITRDPVQEAVPAAHRREP
jgi:hypothetical protein